MACFKNPTALETLAEVALICSFQSKELSICTPRYFDILIPYRCRKERSRKIKSALVECFDYAKRNLEVAFEELTHRKRLDDEKVEVYAHKTIDLVKYAYPKFDQESRDKLAKYNFVKGLQFDVQ